MSSPTGVGSQRPVCVISYSRADTDKYMLQFFEELREGVAERLVRVPEEAVFHDVTSVSAGALWEPKLMTALSNADVLVAMYSPRYFKKFEKLCYCGREFSAFWNRSAPTHIPNRIVPVLWVVSRMEGESFPPEVVAQIQYQLAMQSGGASQRALNLYQEQGLKRVKIRNRPSDYRNLVADIVDRIVQAQSEGQVPPMARLPTFEELRCHFHGEEEEFGSIPVGTVGEIRPGAGPSRVVLIYATEGTQLPIGIADEHLSTRLYSNDNDVQTLRWQISDGFEQVHSTLQKATTENQVPIIIIPHEFRGRSGLERTVDALIGAEDWIGGIATIGAPYPRTSDSGTIRVRDLVNGEAQIDEGLTAILADIRISQTRVGSVHQLPQGTGPDRLPRL